MISPKQAATAAVDSPPSAGEARNTVAVAVPTRDRHASLARLIDALLAQTRRPDEILIIDDGQLDANLLADWRSRCASAKVELRYHRKSQPGRSASRNLAASITACDLVCFLDDDCEPTDQFLDRLIGGLRAYGQWHPVAGAPADELVAVEGMVIPPGGFRLGDRLLAVVRRVSGYWLLARPRWPAKLGDNLRSRSFLCGVCAVHREALQATPFDESMSHSEDREWSVRLARLGRIGRVTDAVCLHHVEPAGRGGSFATGARLARNYLYSQKKLYGWAGLVLACVTLAAMALSDALIGLAGCIAFRRTGPGWLSRAVGMIAGILSPHGRRAD